MALPLGEVLSTAGGRGHSCTEAAGSGFGGAVTGGRELAHDVRRKHTASAIASRLRERILDADDFTAILVDRPLFPGLVFENIACRSRAGAIGQHFDDDGIVACSPAKCGAGSMRTKPGSGRAMRAARTRGPCSTNPAATASPSSAATAIVLDQFVVEWKATLKAGGIPAWLSHRARRSNLSLSYKIAQKRRRG